MDGLKMTKSERRAWRKIVRSQHTLLRHEDISVTSDPTSHIVVGNGGLGNNVSRSDLERIFSPYGHLIDIVLKPRKPFAFVSFASVSEASAAVEALQGQSVEVEAATETSIKLYLSYVHTVPGFEAAGLTLPEGLHLIADFVTVDEEKELLASIDWDYNDPNLKEGSCQSLKHRRVIHFGYEFLYSTNNIDRDCPLVAGIPTSCQPIIQRMLDRGCIKETPDQLTVNQYQPGQGIPPHVDTHSAFEEDLVVLSLGSQAVMDYRSPDGCHLPVLLPQRSLAIQTGPARYWYTHAITPRKSDVLPYSCMCGEGTEGASVWCHGDGTGCHGASDGCYGSERLTLVPRGVRTSFTFRKIRNTPCNCSYPKQCDSQQHASKSEESLTQRAVDTQSKSAARLEEEHVHQVYEEIAGHFSATRHTPWPRVVQFLQGLQPGSLVLDVGCGNGKYLGVNPQITMLGCDRSLGLCEIASGRGHEVFTCDCLAVPFKSAMLDAVISIAVIHHLSTQERRLNALKQLVQLLNIGGKALVYVWAMEQRRGNQDSTYIAKSKDSGSSVSHENNVSDISSKMEGVSLNHAEGNMTCEKDQAAGDNVADACTSLDKADSKNQSEVGLQCTYQSECSLNQMQSEPPKELQVHVNRTQFQSQDLLVPWHLKDKQKKDAPVYHRFYHVFETGELESLCKMLDNVQIVELYYDQGNWCVILQRTS